LRSFRCGANVVTEAKRFYNSARVSQTANPHVVRSVWRDLRLQRRDLRGFPCAHTRLVVVSTSYYDEGWSLRERAVRLPRQVPAERMDRDRLVRFPSRVVNNMGDPCGW
jgi:hypothetical protein